MASSCHPLNGRVCKLRSLLSPSLVSGAGEADATGAVAPSLASADPVGDPPARLGEIPLSASARKPGISRRIPRRVSLTALGSTTAVSRDLGVSRWLSPPPSTLTLHSQ